MYVYDASDCDESPKTNMRKSIIIIIVILFCFAFSAIVCELAKHSTTCNADIKWDKARVVAREGRWTQRKFLEGIESLRGKNRGITPLKSYNQMEQWQSTLYPFFEKHWAIIEDLCVSSSCLYMKLACTCWCILFSNKIVFDKQMIITCKFFFSERLEDSSEKHLPLHTDVPKTVK